MSLFLRLLVYWPYRQVKCNYTKANHNVSFPGFLANQANYHNVAIGNPEWHMRKASHWGSKQQLRSCAAISPITACSRHIYGVVRHAHPVRGKSHI